MANIVRLGTEVRCRITGLRGIAVSRCEFLYGCVRVGVQGKVKDGKLPEAQYIDEPQLEHVGKGLVVQDEYRHGDRPAPQRMADPRR